MAAARKSGARPAFREQLRASDIDYARALSAAGQKQKEKCGHRKQNKSPCRRTASVKELAVIDMNNMEYVQRHSSDVVEQLGRLE